MVESTPSISSGERAFISFLINWQVDTNPGDLITNLAALGKYMTDKLPQKCAENLYRKQYGNLKDCVLAGKGIKRIFQIDGSSFKFQKHDSIMKCENILEPAAF